MIGHAPKLLTLLWLVAWAVAPGVVRAQDMMDQVNLSSPTFTEAEMTREDVALLLDADQAPDLSLRRLNGLDLSGLDFSGANLRGANFTNADLRRADLTGATLERSNFDSAQTAGCIGCPRPH